jgi:hypothetical protein
VSETPLPADAYEQRRAARAAAADAHAARGRVLSNLRLAAFVLAAVAAWFALGAKTLALGWLLPPILAFVALVVVHDRVLGREQHERRAAAFYDRGLARIGYRFAGLGVPGDDLCEAHHPYADDLDLFGAGSVFERICEARTRAGEQALARALLAPAPAPEVRSRQAAVRELAPRLGLREDLALLGEDVRGALHSEALCQWGEGEPRLPLRPHRLVAPLLVALTLAGAALWIGAGAGPIPFAIALLVQTGYALTLRRRVQAVAKGVDAPARELDLFAALLGRIEREPVECERLLALRASLETRGVPPSRRIARLHRLVELLDARRNQFFAPFAALLLWTTQLALALEAWRAEVGPSLARFVETAGDFEALASLAGYAYENPAHAFPEIVEGEPCFEAEALGHPLIPPADCVPNDLALGGPAPRALIVSGSNMSGKSTLLRSVGLAAVLAQAGAPVCAARLRITPLRVGASIRVTDSLQEGASHFYAEITRMRQVMQLSEDPSPCEAALFLLDEIFHGTNSHDRGIGAEAVVEGLLERGAIGLVTTHDLALARVADRLAPRAGNVHFEDHVDAEGRIAFDYRMRAGVVTRSNALALMRSVGLPV